MTETPEICATYNATRRHLSVRLGPTRGGATPVPGRMGPTLCKQDGYDAERLTWHRVFLDPAALPCCRNCERDRLRLGLDAPEGWNP